MRDAIVDISHIVFEKSIQTFLIPSAHAQFVNTAPNVDLYVQAVAIFLVFPLVQAELK